MATAGQVTPAVKRLVLTTDAIGTASVGLLVALSSSGLLVLPPTMPAWPTTGTLALFAALTVASQLAYVRVRHGLEYEELAFFEVVSAAGMMLLAPVPLILATLVGLLVAELIIRRSPIKLAYNMGMYATSTSLMVITYRVLDDGGYILGWRSMISMLVSMVAFAGTNLLFQAALMHYTAGARPADVLREEWRLSGFMAVGGAGVGMVAVSLYVNSPSLLPFAALPAVALWYAYSAAAQHAAARERNTWLIRLGGVLAEHGAGGDLLRTGAEALQQIFGAPRLAVVAPGPPDPSSDEGGRRAVPGPHEIPAGELPDGWVSGVVAPIDTGGGAAGAILLGCDKPYRKSRYSRRITGWRLDEGDEPVLGALVTALASSLRAGMAYDALTEETAKLTAVVDNTSDGIAVVDDSGRVLLWSQTMARMTGVQSEQLTDAAPDAHPEVVRTLLRAATGEQAATSSHVHLTRADGEELDVVLTSVRVVEAASADEGDSGWISILTVHDETRERRVERMKTDFVATISHELRTPITPIKGYAHLLATRGDRIPPAKRQAALQTISDRADHLTRLVDDLLLASRVSDGARLAVEVGVEDLTDIVMTAVGTFPALAPRIRVTPLASPVAVQCDRVRAVQCLSNLIGNAEKYTPPDSPIDIWVELLGMRVAIHVRDHGPGIPASEQARVFERFYRIEDPFTMKTGGAGLGLHIARELAIAMGGGLELVVPAGGGAEFVLYLQTSDAPTVGQRETDPQQVPGGPPAFARTGQPSSSAGRRMGGAQQAQDDTIGPHASVGSAGQPSRTGPVPDPGPQ